MFSLPNLGTGASRPQRTVSTSVHSTSVHSSQTQERSLPRLCEVRETSLIASQSTAEEVRDSEKHFFYKEMWLHHAAGVRGRCRSAAQVAQDTAFP